MAEETSKTETQNHESPTEASDRHLTKQRNEFTHALGTIGRTALTETLTLGANLIPIGLGVAAIFGAGMGITALAGSGAGVAITGAITSAGLAATAIGGITTWIGTKIGWKGVEHSDESKSMFKWGKIVEFASIIPSFLVPILYPAAKLFSTVMTAAAVHSRP